MSFKKQIFIHCLICIGFLSIPLLIFALLFLTSDGRFNIFPYKLSTVISYCFLLVTFYINYYYLIPKFYFEKKYGIYFGVLILAFILLVGIFFTMRSFQHQAHHQHHIKQQHHEIHNDALKDKRSLSDFNHNQFDQHKLPKFFKPPPPIFQYIELIFLLLLGVLFGLYLRIKTRLAQIEIEKNNAERSYLKSQINPHFLFNTFNSIYSLAIKENADLTANGMLMLSGMMRYVVTESSQDFVPIEKEINYINDFIELQKLRLDKGIKLNYKIEGHFDDKRIAPLMLIPFIENAFKHGVNPDENSSIDILISISNHELILKVLNNKVVLNHDLDEKLGFGIENTRNRLNLIYPNNHSLIIEETNLTYQVILKISLL